MTTVFYAWPYGRFTETEQPLEKKITERIKVPIFLEAILAIEIM